MYFSNYLTVRFHLPSFSQDLRSLSKEIHRVAARGDIERLSYLLSNEFNGISITYKNALYHRVVIITESKLLYSKMLIQRFIYDLAGVAKPTSEQLDEEIDRLLFIVTAEEPTSLVPQEGNDQLSRLDSDILSAWLVKKFKPALIQLLLDSSENFTLAKQELNQMERYGSWVDRYLRASFAKKHALALVRNYHFAEVEVPSLQHALTDVKRLLTFVAEHLSNTSPSNMTLFNTDAYTNADITLYSFLKRIMVGKYKDFGLASHVKLCDPLIQFMQRYAAKNIHVIDVSRGDPLSSSCDEPNLIADIVKPATVGLGLILFYIWSWR